MERQIWRKYTTISGMTGQRSRPVRSGRHSGREARRKRRRRRISARISSERIRTTQMSPVKMMTWMKAEGLPGPLQ